MKKKEYLKAHEQSLLEIGKYYAVAHVNVKNPKSTQQIDIDVPIIPIWHNEQLTDTIPTVKRKGYIKGFIHGFGSGAAVTKGVEVITNLR